MIINGLNFLPIHFEFEDGTFNNVFANYQANTLRETLVKPKYIKFANHVDQNYSDQLDLPLGQFLLYLKQNCDNYYKKFLNPNGDLEYSNFLINDDLMDQMGVYAFYFNEKSYQSRIWEDTPKKLFY